MIFTDNVGVVTSTGDVRKAEKVECGYVAGGQILVGMAVQISTVTTTPYGAAVIAGTTAGDHALCGIYEGKGSGKVKTAVSGMAGVVAESGDAVLVTTFGHAVALCHATTSATDSTVAALDAVTYAVTAARGTKGTAPAATLIAAVVALEEQTASATGGAATDVFVRFM